MTHGQLKQVLTDLQQKKISIQAASKKLQSFTYEDLHFAKLDHARVRRKGFPESVYAPGKTAAQLLKIIEAFSKEKNNVVVTRLESEVFTELKETFPKLEYSSQAKIGYLRFEKQIRKNIKSAQKPIVVLSAGTTDIPVAEEAALVLELFGKKVLRLYDCGVAGLARLIDQIPKLKKSKAVICVAGMEGALPSVVAGLIDRPVIAVPTSVGYGANFEGLSALLGMMNSCAEGIAVVNIDNGFGAACFAASL